MCARVGSDDLALSHAVLQLAADGAHTQGQHARTRVWGAKGGELHGSSQLQRTLCTLRRGCAC